MTTISSLLNPIDAFVTITTIEQQQQQVPSPIPPPIPFASKRPQRLQRRLFAITTQSTTTNSSSSADNSSSSWIGYDDEDFFLKQIESTIDNVLSNYNYGEDKLSISNIPPGPDREAVGIAINLRRRIQNLRKNNDCPRCWMQRAHCICSQIQSPIDLSQIKINRIFILINHKEICLKVDTAKLIMMTFPKQTRVVVAGIDSKYQSSMKDMVEAMSTSENCLVLFPDDNAKLFSEIYNHDQKQQQQHATTTTKHQSQTQSFDARGYDIIILDGTWSQARKMCTRYIPQAGGSNNNTNINPKRVQLSPTAVESLMQLQKDNTTTTTTAANINVGHQLRRHDVVWKQVGTFEALRLFLLDVAMTMMASSATAAAEITDTTNTTQQQQQPHNDKKEYSDDGITTTAFQGMIVLLHNIKSYQEIANNAAICELGPPRVKKTKEN